ncbi:hypothetical protein KR200_007443 [Drosophila serrata]|nr:hypothetical protein KR200_007443 [Drosophila serrata]
MTCLSVMSVRYSSRCILAKKLRDCDRYTNIINYFELMYCDLKVRNESKEIGVLCLFVLIYFLFFCVVFICINEYYLPALKIAAIRLKLNEYLAGVLLVGVANSTSDFMLNFSAVRSGSPTMNLAMSNALTSICVMGGTIYVIMPFKINSASVFRDFLFVIFLLQLIRFFIQADSPTYWAKGLIILLIYPIYLAVNIIDFLLMRYNIRSNLMFFLFPVELRREIEILRYKRSSPMLDKKLYDKVTTLKDLEVDDDFKILRMKTRYGIFRAGVFVTPKPLVEPRKVDVESNRVLFHNKNNPKNRFLFTEFIQDLNPIDPEHWMFSGKYGRAALICVSPAMFLLRLAIPMVNYEQIKHGWSKLLNCIQIITNPFLVAILLETAYFTTHNNSWLINIYFDKALWSLVVTVPLSLIVFVDTRTDIPPPYHKLFSIFTIVTVVTLIWICSWEMEVIISIIGSVFNQSSNYMTVTFNAFSNAVPDMIAYIQLSKNGYGKMAFGGIVGGIVFDITINLGAQFARSNSESRHLLGDFGETIYIFLLLTVFSTSWMCLVLDFNARRSGGIFLWCLYVMFFIYVTLIEANVIHDFTADRVIEVKD